MRRLDLGPGVLREQGIATRLAARDLGDVIPAPYRDFVRPPGRPRNENDVAEYSRALAQEVRAASDDGSFILVLGGDCSIVLGGLLGARKFGGLPVGLAYVDAHADYATPEESATGSAASMCLALATGRGDTPLARLAGDSPLARPEDVVVIGRRDDEEPYYGQDALHASEILDLPHVAVRERGTADVASTALDRLTRSELGGFWIHVDADVLDPSVMPAVDSPEPNGLLLDELAELLTPLASHEKALGLEVTIYDPKLDPDRSSAARMVSLLEQTLSRL